MDPIIKLFVWVTTDYNAWLQYKSRDEYYLLSPYFEEKVIVPNLWVRLLDFFRLNKQRQCSFYWNEVLTNFSVENNDHIWTILSDKKKLISLLVYWYLLVHLCTYSLHEIRRRIMNKRYILIELLLKCLRRIVNYYFIKLIFVYTILMIILGFEV